MKTKSLYSIMLKLLLRHTVVHLRFSGIWFQHVMLLKDELLSSCMLFYI